MHGSAHDRHTGNELPVVAADADRVGFKSHLRPETVPGQAVYLVSQRG